jgi:hypothetical protein
MKGHKVVFGAMPMFREAKLVSRKSRMLFLGGLVVGLLAFGLMVAGCASTPARSGFMDGGKPLQVVSTVNTTSSKTGTLTSTVWLGIFGEVTYPTIAAAAQKGGITKIATVEYYVRPGILNLWAEYTTVVTGE